MILTHRYKCIVSIISTVSIITIVSIISIVQIISIVEIISIVSIISTVSIISIISIISTVSIISNGLIISIVSIIYVQRCVCFVNVQVPCPHFNIYVKLYISRIYMQMSSFLYACAQAIPDNISGLMSVGVWLSSREVINEKSGHFSLEEGGK